MDGAQFDTHSNDMEAKAVAFDELSMADTISVRTKRSSYQFLISDPSSRKGTLTGGFLGDQAASAVLSGAMSVDQKGFDPGGLKTGCRAVFFLEAKDRVQRLVTSVITDIAHTKSCVNENRAA